MEIRVQTGDVTSVAADLLIVNLFEGVTTPGGATGAVDSALDGAISQIIAAGDISGKSGETYTLMSNGRIAATRVLIAGLGKAEEFDVHRARNLSATLVRAVRKPGISSVATIVHGAGIGNLDVHDAAQALAEGAILGDYRFTRHKGTASSKDQNEITSLTIIESDADRTAAIEAGVARGTAIAESVNFTRDLANEPSNHLTPTMLADRALEMAAAAGLEAHVLEEAEMQEKGMGSLLSVARGSAEPAKLIAVSYRGREGDGYDVGLVGKGITFDTGGISLKPPAGMEAMKADMTGAATVLGAIRAIAALKPKANVLAIACCTENMPGGKATKPGDVVTAMNGVTIEVLNTDAEGRLVLADGICYARELGAVRLVDVATLTGAISISLGSQAYGLFTNNEDWLGEVEAAVAGVGERAWALPMWKEYGDQIKSDVADIKNTGGRDAGSITAAKFIEHFVDDVPWVHMDIAGVDNLSKARGWQTKGASGLSVRPLIALAERLAQQDA